jgi:hypothetical protein
MAFRRIFTCPFCVSAVGSVGVNTDTVLATALLSQEDLKFGIDASSRAMLSFDASGPRSGPCPHVLSFHVDIDVRHTKDIGDVNAERMKVSFEWEHSKLKKLGLEMNNFIWLSIFNPWPRNVRPSTPYRVRRMKRRIDIRGTPLSMQCYIYVILAADRQRFLDEVPVRYARWQSVTTACG